MGQIEVKNATDGGMSDGKKKCKLWKRCQFLRAFNIAFYRAEINKSDHVELGVGTKSDMASARSSAGGTGRVYRLSHHEKIRCCEIAAGSNK